MTTTTTTTQTPTPRGAVAAALRSPRLRAIALAAGGALAMALALACSPALPGPGLATVRGEVFAVLAALAACAGWGTALARLLGPAAPPTAASLPEPLAERAALGLAALLSLGTALAYAGLASRAGLWALVGAGLAAGLVPPRAAPASLPAARAFSWPQLAAVACGAAFLLSVELFDLTPVLGDRRTHAFDVARLWQLSALPSGPGHLGGQTIGQAIFALGGDARSAGVFDAGAGAALLVALLAAACARPRPARGFLLLALLALPVVFFRDSQSAPTARWTATLLILAGGLRLRRAVALGARDRGVFVIAVALVCLRGELALPATALCLGGLILPRGLSGNRTKRAVALRFGLTWILPLAAALTLAGARPYLVPAVVAAGALGFAVAHLLVRVCRLAPWRDEVPFALAAAAGTALLSSARLAGGLLQATFPVWTALVALALSRAFVVAGPGARPGESHSESESEGEEDDDEPDVAPLRTPLHALLLFAALATAFTPALDPNRYQRAVRRLTKLTQTLPALGLSRAVASDAAALQARAPAGAPIGFWGQNPAGLDFRRNPITDISWAEEPRTNGAFLAPLSRRGLARFAALRYVLMASPPASPAIVWDVGRDLTGELSDVLELVAESGSAKLFRVRRAAARPPELQ